MAPGPLSALTHIGFGRYNQAGQQHLADNYGSVLIINAQRISHPAFKGTILHEAAHAYENLLNYYDLSEGVQGLVTQTRGQWPQETLNLAQETMHQLGLRFNQGFGELWRTIHRAGLRYSLTFDYVGD